MVMQPRSTMRPSEKLALIDKIGRTLQSKFGYAEIDLYLAEYNIPPPTDVTTNSKWIYSKTALKRVSLDTIIRIAEDLGLEQEIRRHTWGKYAATQLDGHDQVSAVHQPHS
jgi:hypothetical protein